MSSAANSIADTSHQSSRGSRNRSTPTHSTSATHDMIHKLDALFSLKTRTLMMDAFDRLTPLKNLAKIPEFRSSLEKVMPEKAVDSAGSRLMDENEFDFDDEDHHSELLDEGSEFSMEMGLQKMGAALEMDASKDKRAAKSIIRLSNAIIPLLTFYNASVESSSASASASAAPAIKAATTPVSAKKGKNKAKSSQQSSTTTPNKTTIPSTTAAATSSAPIAVPIIDVTEVHHAFHAVLKQVHRLESSLRTTALAYTPPEDLRSWSESRVCLEVFCYLAKITD